MPSQHGPGPVVSPLRATAIAVLVAVVTWLVYSPGFNSPFIGDDVPNIVDNRGIAIENLSADSLPSAARSNTSSPLGRPVPALSFALNYWFSGQKLEPAHFKATNLAIHLLNGVLLYSWVACNWQSAKKPAAVTRMRPSLHPSGFCTRCN